MRQDVNEFNPDQYWEEKFAELPGIRVDSSSFENLHNLSEGISYHTTISFDKEPSLSGEQDVVYLQPFLFLREEENPFKRQKRELPVEFSYPYSKQYMITVELPEGYEVEEYPQSFQTIIPNQGGSYRFISTLQDNTLTMIAGVTISAYHYSTEEYADVRKLFQDIVDSQNAFVVLKKKTTE